MAVIGAIVQISWNCNNWQGYPKCINPRCPGYKTPLPDFPDCNGCRYLCPCVTNSGHGYIIGQKWGAEWCNFDMSGRVPNMHQGRIYGYAPFGNRQRAELYIDYVQAHGANNFGIIFFVAKDLHNEGRRIVGVYGNANIHGICNEQWSRHGRYPLRPPDPPKFPPFDAYLGSLIFDDFPPPADVANILINLPLQHWFTPHLSGEIEISTHFPPLDALTYIPGLDRYCRSTPCFPLILDDKSKDKVWKGYEIPDAYSLSKKILDDAKATTTDPVVIRKIDALIKKVEQSRHSA